MQIIGAARHDLQFLDRDAEGGQQRQGIRLGVEDIDIAC